MSQIIDNEVKVNENTKKTIKQQLRKIYQEKLNSVFKRMTLTKTWTFVFSAFIILTLTLVITGCVLTFKDYDKFTTAKTMFIIAAILGLISTLSLSLSWIVRNTIKKQFSNSIMAQYYNTVAQSNIKELSITSISQDFSIFPEKFFPQKNFNNTIDVEQVIIGNYLDHEFNLGTVLEKITEETTDNDGKTSQQITYHRYLFFTINIAYYDYTTTIKPESFLSKIMQRNKVKLESSEFEKIFAVDYSDPIKLRKLFQPKVMADMIDYSQGKKVPYIYLNQEQVTIMLPYYNIHSINSQNGNLMHFKINGNFQTTANNLVLAIENDLQVFLSLVNWIKILNLI